MARYRIETPVKDASGDLGPIHFHMGKAEVDEIPQGVRQYCTLNGYAITDTQATETVEPTEDATLDTSKLDADAVATPTTPSPSTLAGLGQKGQSA